MGSTAAERYNRAARDVRASDPTRPDGGKMTHNAHGIGWYTGFRQQW
jgi:hypothetical protein